MSDQSRRAFLKGSGAATAGLVGLASAGSAAAATGSSVNGWTEAKAPTTKTLHDVVQTANGPVAVGGGGDVVQRKKGSSLLGGSPWKRVVDAGPAAKGNTLTTVDVTDDGVLVWFAGSSGVIGTVNTVTGQLTNYSAPKGKTSTWESVSVTGFSNTDEHVYLFNGSGEFLPGTRQSDGSMKWGTVVKPGGGSTIPGSSFWGQSSGAVPSTSQGCFQTTDGGSSWTKIGVPNSSATFNDIAAASGSDMNIAGSGGIILRYDGNRWTPMKVGSHGVESVDRASKRGLAAGGSGMVWKRSALGSWTAVETPTGATLKGVAMDPTETHPDVAVGSSATIVERKAP